MQRMQDRGQNITVNFYMVKKIFFFLRIFFFFMQEANTETPVSHYNILAEFQGSEFPEQVVVLGGHTDSWDVGTGCMDDGKKKNKKSIFRTKFRLKKKKKFLKEGDYFLLGNLFIY
jgi:hypothetical protein